MSPALRVIRAASTSTETASWVGRKRALVAALDTINTDPDDSILAAEIAGARRLLDQLDPERVRVGVVSFSGEIDPATGRRRSFEQADSLLEHPLSSNFESVAQALEAVRLRGPHGGTNMEAGVKHALREVAGLVGAQSVPRNGAKKVILLMTDGKPSLPFGRADVEDPEDVEAAVAAAELAKSAGITINVFGLGPNAIDYPQAATAVARATAGLYTPVRRPGDIVSLLSGVSFANVEDVVAVNPDPRRVGRSPRHSAPAGWLVPGFRARAAGRQSDSSVRAGLRWHARLDRARHRISNTRTSVTGSWSWRGSGIGAAGSSS